MEARKTIRQKAFWGLFILFALWFGWLIATQMILGFGVLGGVIAMFLAFLCFANVTWAICCLTAYAFFNSGLATLLSGAHFQAGIPLDIILVITLAGMMVNKERVKEAGQGFFRSPVVIGWMVLFGYYFLQIANPFVHNPIGWVNMLRKTAEQTLLFFICYCAFDSPERIKIFLKAFFVMSVLVGFYGCIQQWHGLFPFEMAWVMADPTRFGLLFVMGEFRKWSTMADPTSFGIVMASVSAFYIIIALYQRKAWKRWLLFFGILFMVLGMFYSGTRTANVVLLAGLFMYLLLQSNKTSTWVFGIGVAAALLTAINLPIYSNSTLNRFRTTFAGEKDASYNVREVSRKFIQPYILQHPIGGGLGTTNDFGKLNNPGHYLAGFQTDDGYLRLALEVGWIGLGLICFWMFTVLRSGIHGYFRARSPDARYLYVAILACLVPFMVSMLAQDVIGMMSDDAVIFPMVAIMLRLDVFDKS